ncbi:MULTISPECIES: MDR family oxidoreductase [Arsenicicoccus]|uniref:MDR family oxidoreductase n=1 Tax=Arsenicicoccus TaxID=267408 RepID=UPI00257E46D4|nr:MULTISPECIES: MDR family oxidoreductase [Actinomycetes]
MNSTEPARRWPAYVIREPGPAALVELTEADLPPGDVTVEISHSSLNFKDGLAVTGKGRIARRLPMVCGIDLAGTVAASDSPDWSVGDDVIVTGHGLSETEQGAYTARQRVQSGWLVRRPETLTAEQAMGIGTAGLTAMMCILRLEEAGVVPGGGPVVVTGAGGGVGSVAVAILAKLGYEVEAVTGRSETHDYLSALGAAAIVDRAQLAEPGKPLQAERWAAAVDTVAGVTLANVLSQIRYGGSVAACGLASGNDLPTTILPFILRGVNLLGVDSVMAPMPVRIEAWRRLGTDLPAPALAEISRVEPFSAVPALAEDILAGRIRGRVVIDIAAESGTTDSSTD